MIARPCSNSRTVDETRLLLTEAAWGRIAAVLSDVKHPAGAPPKLPDRDFVEAMLYLARTGTPWRDLPARFGNALTVAVKLLEPKAQHVSLPGGTIKGEDDLKSWLATAEETIRAKLKDGPVIL